MPHRHYVESAAELQPPRLRRQVRPHKYQIGDALIALALKVVFRHPERVKIKFVHQAGNLRSGIQALHKPLIRIAAHIGGSPLAAHIIQVYIAHIQDRKVLYHAISLASAVRQASNNRHAVAKPSPALDAQTSPL